VRRLIAPPDAHDGVLYCPACYVRTRRKHGYDHTLNQTLERWTHRSKKTDSLVHHKLTKGKDWEIENRRVSLDDGKTVINKATGKPAQY
jgi:hypothetical protein